MRWRKLRTAPGHMSLVPFLISFVVLVARSRILMGVFFIIREWVWFENVSSIEAMSSFRSGSCRHISIMYTATVFIWTWRNRRWIPLIKPATGPWNLWIDSTTMLWIHRRKQIATCREWILLGWWIVLYVKICGTVDAIAMLRMIILLVVILVRGELMLWWRRSADKETALGDLRGDAEHSIILLAVFDGLYEVRRGCVRLRVSANGYTPFKIVLQNTALLAKLQLFCRRGWWLL